MAEVTQAGSAGILMPAMTLAQRELARFFRQRSRVTGSLMQPVIFWALFGQMFNKAMVMGPGGMLSSALSGRDPMDYKAYFFPGTVVMTILFTAIFSTISIIEDRKEGFLQSVLVAPVPRIAIVLGKILGGTALAMIQGLVLLVLAPLAGVPLHLASLPLVALIMFMTGFALTGLGFIIAWRMDSTQGFHAIMMVFLMPLWLLSGAMVPVSRAPEWMGWVMSANPLTYALSALRQALYAGTGSSGETLSLPLCLAVTAAFGLLTLGVSVMVAGKPVAGDLQ